jgi:2-polyprenyl-3-methyl-5-hydroxy-6-metoxy-1,4-benzoquinol methylase
MERLSAIARDEQYWDSVADRWNDTVFNTLKHDKEQVIVAELTRLARQTRKIADYGCGTGLYLPTLCKLFDEVHGFDLSPECIEMARTRVPSGGHAVLSAGKAAPRAARGKFQAVLCVNAAIHPGARQWRSVLKSARALLAPGGELILVVPALESARMLAQAAAARGDDTVRLGRAGTIMLDGEPVHHFTRAELQHELAALGLAVARIKPVEYSWASHGLTPPKELRHHKLWDWLAVAHPAAV